MQFVYWRTTTGFRVYQQVGGFNKLYMPLSDTRAGFTVPMGVLAGV